MPDTKLRLGRTLRTAMERTRKAKKLTELNANNASKLECWLPIGSGRVLIDNLGWRSPSLELSKGGCTITLGSRDDIRALRDFLNEHFPPPARRKR